MSILYAHRLSPLEESDISNLNTKLGVVNKFLKNRIESWRWSEKFDMSSQIKEWDNE